MIEDNFILIIFIFTLFNKSVLSGRVETYYGGIEGEIKYYKGIPIGSYLGIPYAKPPVGDLRFRKPQPVEPWEGTLEAKAMRPGCIQYSTNPFPWLDDLPGLSEDCLYLNIWAPVTVGKKTVMFWIHGGGFRIGSSRLDFYNGTVLAADGNVIVVTINYRLGPQGFLYSGTDDAPGNMGLLDIVAALKWVRSHIELFGGDRNSITLFGQSAGAIAIGMFCVSPITRGLFRRAVMQSGAPTNLDGEDNDRSFHLSQKLAENVGCAHHNNSLRDNPELVVSCLRSVDGLELAITLSNITASDSRSYYPRYGDELLPSNVRLSLIAGDSANVDVLIGSNNGDGASLITKNMKEVFGFFGERDPQINMTLGKAIVRKQFSAYHDPESVVRHYLGPIKDDDYEGIRRQVFTASGDYQRVCPCVYFAESYAKKSDANTYNYFFTHRPSVTPWAPWMLAVHFDETPFVFGHPLRYDRLYSSKDKKLSKLMIKIWTTFAKTGNPFVQVGSVSEDSFDHCRLNLNFTVSEGAPKDRNCDFFRKDFGF